MSIDWSKAPEGATHWGPRARCEIGAWIEGFYKYNEEEGCWEHFHAGLWRQGMEGHEDWAERLASLERRHKPWNGEGLPPVGISCEVKNVISGDYDQVDEVLAHTEINCAHVAVFKRDGGVFYSQADQFRSIRTPEQIAEDERSIAVSEIVKTIGWTHVIPGADEAAGRLYDAGYRKQPPTD